MPPPPDPMRQELRDWDRRLFRYAASSGVTYADACERFARVRALGAHFKAPPEETWTEYERLTLTEALDDRIATGRLMAWLEARPTPPLIDD